MGLFFNEQQQQPDGSQYYPTLRKAPRVDGTILRMFPQGSAMEPVVYENKPQTPQGFFTDVINSGKERLNNISNPEPSDLREVNPPLGAALNVIGQAGGFLGDILGTGLKAVTPDPVRQSVEDFAEVVLPGNPVYETAKDIWNTLPQGTQNDIGNLTDATMLIPEVGMVGRGATLKNNVLGTLKEIRKIPGDMIKAAVVSDTIDVLKKKVADFYDRVISTNPSQNIREWLGGVSKNNIEAVKQKTGIDLTGYERVIDSSGINHILKNHGDEVTEAKRGQIGITRNDISRIPEIVESPDDIQYVG